MRRETHTYDEPVSSATVGVGDDDFVTGEAVALDLPPASIGSRMLSGFLDYLIVWVVTFTLASAGAALAARLACDFIELDKTIERQHGASSATLFEVYGQAAFRRYERECLTRIVGSSEATVIATA